MATRTDILNTAKGIVSGQRENDYGKPEDSFQIIGDLWSSYLGHYVSAADVAMMMCLLKIARIKHGGSVDSYVDLAGYAACGGEIATKAENDNVNRMGDKALPPD